MVARAGEAGEDNGHADEDRDDIDGDREGSRDLRFGLETISPAVCLTRRLTLVIDSITAVVPGVFKYFLD